MVTPDSTVTVRSPGSCSTSRARRRSPSTTPARAAGIPTEAAVPPPQGTTGASASPQRPITAATSSSAPGNTAASGVRPSTTYGESSTPVMTLAGPTAARSRSSSASCTRRVTPALEALGEALGLDRVRRVGDGADLDTRLLRGEDLPGVAETRGVEGVLEPLHHRQVGGREDEGHEVGLLEADAVLARDRAADLGADLHDLGAGLYDARLRTGHARIVEDVRVQVAVARMEDVADAQAVGGDDLVHAAEHVRELRSRNDAVHHHVRR